jgi:hypothetical protein
MTKRSTPTQPPLLKRASNQVVPAIVALFIGAFAVMAVDRNSPVDVVWGKIVPPEVYAGQPITFHYGSIKYTDYGGNIKRWVVDVNGSIYFLTDTDTVGQKLEYNKEAEVVKSFVVPCGIAVGPAMYHSDAALYAWWNIVQWIFPIHREIKYPFSVIPGAHNGVCAVQGEPGKQGPPGIQGPARP